MTGLYLARGWVLWFWRYQKQKSMLLAVWGGIFLVLLQMTYQIGAGPRESAASKLATKSVVTTLLAEVTTPVAAAAAAPPQPAPAPAPVPVVQGFVYSRHAGNSYAWGNCTFYVANRRSIPGNWGNARSWLYNARNAGFATGSEPLVGAIAWTGAGYLGHVALVEEVTGNQVKISEMNGIAGYNRVGYRWVPAGAFLYIY